jgi:peptidyl-prolyl cis-trans isomerase A (cyclophilin A)
MLLAILFAAISLIEVVIETELGMLEIAVNVGQAPRTAANFLKYVDAQMYTGGHFHRTVRTVKTSPVDNQPNSTIKIDVIQGGRAAAENAKREPADFSPLALERTSTTGLRHLRGTISMARAQPDSATSDFFICVEDEPQLDFGGMRNPDGQGFAAFGQVTKGMDLVRRIQQSPAEGQRLTPSIRILRIYRKQ